ncbi:MAG: glycosyltransferase family 9 protein [Candidatus Nitrohelix vancouverensis]|uniref:Glycosyltransferase family 9 protein n=1 Tax=Candidatus Nitrohelix vancouverensis TaxID=2705534 RepID=A0A7T0G398_9BACT|nr:MAG: glycosyltransferase family 9 protein [Candidatus Nitrohelix vancouverensis]
MTQLLKDRIPKNAKILLIKLRSIGDVVYNTSVYGPLKQCFPDSELTVLVEPASYDLVRSHPAVDVALCFRKGSFLEQARFYFNLFAHRYDVAIDMHEGTRGAVMCFVSQARYRVGHRFAKRSFLYNETLQFEDLAPRFPIEYQAALVNKMGVAIDAPRPEIHLDDSVESAARERLRALGIADDEDFCIVHCGTRKVYDQWQYKKFAELCQEFHSQLGVKAVLTCGPGEEAQARQVLDHAQGTPFFVAGLQELGWISRRARFAVCHNGGYMHFASALGTPVIALFGVVNPRIWKPLGERDIVLYKEIECSPCNSKTRKPECYDGDAECKRNIETEDVLNAARRILSPA